MSDEAVPFTASQSLFDQQREAPATPPVMADAAILFEIARFEEQQNDTTPKHGEYVLMCEFCLKRFIASNKNSGLQRTSYEYEVLRRTLMITDHRRLPVVCDPCCETMSVPPEQHVMGFPNPVLMQGMTDAAT